MSCRQQMSLMSATSDVTGALTNSVAATAACPVMREIVVWNRCPITHQLPSLLPRQMYMRPGSTATSACRWSWVFWVPQTGWTTAETVKTTPTSALATTWGTIYFSRYYILSCWSFIAKTHQFSSEVRSDKSKWNRCTIFDSEMRNKKSTIWVGNLFTQML